VTILCAIRSYLSGSPWRDIEHPIKLTPQNPVALVDDDTGLLKALKRLLASARIRIRRHLRRRIPLWRPASKESCLVLGAQAELARVARLTTIGELAASIAHEINQPLPAIATNGHAALRWLGHAMPNVSEATEALKGVIKDVNRASDVIGRIRALLKHDKPEYMALDINDVIREVHTITQTALQSRLVSVRSDLPAGLPPVLGDRVQLQQVIMNLIMNDADAMSSVTNRPRILQLVSRIDPSGSMVVAIEDSGTGLDAILMERIFDPLFTTKPNGMGMGLAICKSIVEAHGGRIWALPRRPNGSVFQFTVRTVESAA
jgi:C4-dicarboxylate-specific signal transduction histidine kinase